MKIRLENPTGAYQPTIDTDAHDVHITEAYLPVFFTAESGEMLRVCQRDSGFEIRYATEDAAFDRGDYIDLDLKRGEVSHSKEAK